MTRTNWTRAEIAALFNLPFTELVFRAKWPMRSEMAGKILPGTGRGTAANAVVEGPIQRASVIGLSELPQTISDLRASFAAR